MKTIEKLYNNSVCNFELHESKTKITVTECCDYYYEVDLSKEEVKQLIDELTVLYSQMS